MSEVYNYINSFIIVLDSKNAATYYNDTSNSDVHFHLSDPIIKPQDCLYMTMTVYSFTCPVSFYLINATNNILAFTVGSTTTSYNFPYGNYNSNTFINMFNTLVGSNYTITLQVAYISHTCCRQDSLAIVK